MAAAYFSSSAAATAPSPTAVTTCRRLFTQISPAAYSPSTFVFWFLSVITYPCSFRSAIPLRSSVAGSYPANTNTPKVSPSLARYSVTLQRGGEAGRAAADHHHVVEVFLIHSHNCPTRSRLGFRVSAPGCHLAGQTSSPCSATNWLACTRRNSSSALRPTLPAVTS